MSSESITSTRSSFEWNESSKEQKEKEQEKDKGKEREKYKGKERGKDEIPRLERHS